MAGPAQTSLSFASHRNPEPVAVADRAKVLADPGFGRVFTDHMAVIRYTEGKGWHSAEVTARKPLMLDPASAVLHYAQEIFEGLKAYKLADGSMAMFRPDANARRFQHSAAASPCRSCRRSCSSSSIRQARRHRPRLVPDRRGRLALHPSVHVRQRGVPRRQAVVGISLSRDRLAGRRLLQERRAGGFDLGVAELHARRTGRHGCGQVRRQLRHEPRARRPRRPSTAAIRSCSSTRPSTNGSRNSAA